MTSKNALIVFVKYPEIGTVKTRLAATTDREFAYEFYKLCCSHIFSEITKIISNDLRCFVFYTGSKDVNLMKEWLGYDFDYADQRGSDLGEKMKNAFKKIFECGYSRALIIGTDIPDITGKIILEEFANLEEYDYVISPSADGGYNYLGMKKNNTNLFDDIRWSTEEVLDKTLNKIREDSNNYRIAGEMIDIDTEDELYSWLYHNHGNEELKTKVEKLIDERNKSF